MAEVFVGTVASGVTIGALGAQVTIGVVKLKSLWNKIKDAPENLRDLIEELELLSQLLADAERDQERNPLSGLVLDPHSKSQCLQYCKKSVIQLKKLTDDFADALETKGKLRKTWSSAKIVFKNDETRRFESKLKRSIRLLSISLQLYQKSVLLIPYPKKLVGFWDFVAIYIQ